MNKKIRKSVFETNSSSSHTLSIKVGDNSDKIYTDVDNEIVFVGGIFGWGFEKHKDATTKANYLAVLLMSFDDYYKRYKKSNNNSFCDYYEKNVDMFRKNFEQSIRNNQQVYSIDYYLSNDNRNIYYSVIDHQSCEVEACYKIFESIDDITNFIYNTNSELIIHHDNIYSDKS